MNLNVWLSTHTHTHTHIHTHALATLTKATNDDFGSFRISFMFVFKSTDDGASTSILNRTTRVLVSVPRG